jgi:Kef-type K+ transport system membrane component KefB
VISFASVLIPFVSGYFLAHYIYPYFTLQGISKSNFCLFFGIALSFTALPVLARILHEKGLHKSKLGIISITSAAVNDLFAWLMLAVTIAIAKSDSILTSVSTIFFAITYVLVMLKIIRPFLKRVCDLNVLRDKLNKSVFSIFILLLLISSYIAELIGIHALFGAFLAGAIVPENKRFRNMIIGKIEDFTIVLLLPIFFVFTGLRTQFGLISGKDLWLVTWLVITVAIFAKFLGSALAAKLIGQNWKDSLTIGALLNTRGLIPLIILNIGLDIGFLNAEVFSILVLMAMITTLMTGPVLSLINHLFKPKNVPNHNEIFDKTKYKILISFANPVMGKFLLRLANAIIKKMIDNAIIVATHFYNADEMGRLNSIDYENNTFALINEESKLLNQKYSTVFKAAHNIETSIAKMANEGDYDLLLIGIGKSVFEGSFLGKILGYTNKIITPEKLIQQVVKKDNQSENLWFDQRTNDILQNCNMPVGVFINKSDCCFENILIPVLSEGDAYILKTAQLFIANSSSQIVFVDYFNFIREDRNFIEQIRMVERTVPNHITVVSKYAIDEELLSKQDLILISPASWKKCY